MPWRVDGIVGGHVHESRVDWLLRDSRCFLPDGDGLRLDADSYEARSAALRRTVDQLVASGQLPPLRGELYPVYRSLADEPLLYLDRTAVTWFGVRPFGVHLNGFVQRDDGLHLWIAQRSRGKHTFPGMLDNMVAGGQPLGLSLRQNLIKECWEEAGMPQELAQAATAASTVTYVAQQDRGLKPDTLYCFDLEVPEDFLPRPQDGEVERFTLMPLSYVLEVVRDSERFKPNCNLVVIDFALRHGALDAEFDAAARQALASALRRPLP